MLDLNCRFSKKPIRHPNESYQGLQVTRPVAATVVIEFDAYHIK